MNLEGVDLEGINLKFAKLQFRMRTRERYRIYRKMESMLNMNEALSRCLDRLYQNVSEMGKYPNRPAAVALREWFIKDRAGISLSEAMDGWIPSSDLYMIRAGEESGTISKALGSIQKMGERARQMREAVSYAITYPAFMMVLISFVLWMFGVNLIQNMRATAPKQVIDAMGDVAMVSDFIRDWGITVAVAIVAFFLCIAVTLPFWTGALRAKLDMYPPWSWYRILQGSGFLLGLSTLLGAQVTLKRSLEILEEQSNPWMRERLSAVRQEVLRGRNLGEALRVTRMNFPDPAVAVDLEVLSERADVALVIEQITTEWMREQIDAIKVQAAISRNIGMVIVGGTIAWAMSSVFNVVTVVSKGSGGG